MNSSASVPEPASTDAEPVPAARPAWVDAAAYPFDSYHIDLGPGRLHYVDEGEGRPVVMLHGEPTWSFLYRHLIGELADGYRCIAPDYYGFGLSDKPREWSYRVPDHARVIERLLAELDVDDVTLVCHDWGGPIGLDYAVEHPENVHSLVVTQTFAWPVTEEHLQFRLLSALGGNPLARYLNREYNAFAAWGMPLVFGDRSRLTPEIHRHYLEPLADPGDRRGATEFPRELHRSRDWLKHLWDRRAALADTPALLCWGMADPAFRVPILRRWQALFPEARTVEFHDAGHFVPEENGPEMATETARFLSELD